MSSYALFSQFCIDNGFTVAKASLDRIEAALKRGDLEVRIMLTQERLILLVTYKGAFIELLLSHRGHTMNGCVIEGDDFDESFYAMLASLFSSGAYETEGRRVENVTYATMRGRIDVKRAFDMETGAHLTPLKEFYALAKSEPAMPVKLLVEREMPEITTSITVSDGMENLARHAFEDGTATPIASVTCRTWRELSVATAKFVENDLRRHFAVYAESITLRKGVALVGWAK